MASAKKKKKIRNGLFIHGSHSPELKKKKKKKKIGKRNTAGRLLIKCAVSNRSCLTSLIHQMTLWHWPPPPPLPSPPLSGFVVTPGQRKHPAAYKWPRYGVRVIASTLLAVAGRAAASRLYTSIYASTPVIRQWHLVVVVVVSGIREEGWISSSIKKILLS